MEGKKELENPVMDQQTVRKLESLLRLFEPSELEDFYAEHSKHMLLTTSANIERHEAMQKLLAILCQKD